jgi:hypothetical protein
METEEKFWLYYAPLVLEGDIPCIEFDTQKDLIQYINEELHPQCDNLGSPLSTTSNIVFLVAYKDEIYVSHILNYIIDFIESMEHTSYDFSGDEYTVHLHEYPSFEEAYTIAKSMKEGNKLCYSSETIESPYWKNTTPEFIENI